MYARNVSFRLKSDMQSDYTRTFENQILPLLRKQKGFKDEMLFLVPGAPEVVAISLWESRENLEAWERAGYPELVKLLANVVEKAPEVKTYQLGLSTLHKLGDVALRTQSPNTTPAAGVGG